MASSKAMPSSNSRNLDLTPHSTSSAYPTSALRPQKLRREAVHDQTNKTGGYSEPTAQVASAMTVDGILEDVYGTIQPTGSTLLDSSITLMDAPAPLPMVAGDQNGGGPLTTADRGDELWRDIVYGERKEMKEEASEEIMTLEDFLVKAGAVEGEPDMKVPPEGLSGGAYVFDQVTPNPFQMLNKVEDSIAPYGNGVDVYSGSGGSGGGGGRNKRGRPLMEPLDKAAAQRQRRMIKNRESAARSRERKQAYQVELESEAARLEEENERLLKEQAERTRERYKKLMETVIPVVEKRRETRFLRRVRSLEW